MENKKIGDFIKEQRKKKNLTQEELANKLFVTEKAISRWETGRGTPDISLLIPLSKELDITPSELLSGKKENINSFVEYVEENKKLQNNKFKSITILLYSISIFIYIFYLKFEYNTTIFFKSNNCTYFKFFNNNRKSYL